MVDRRFEKYLDKPFAYWGRGPEEYDCYGLLKQIYKDVRGIELPDYQSAEDIERIAALMAAGLNDWKEVDEQPDVAIMFRVKGYGGHVGYSIGGGRFIHTWEKSCGVCIERLQTWQSRIIGFYDYVGQKL